MRDRDRVLYQAITAFYDGLMNKLANWYGGDYAELMEKWLELHVLYLENANRYLEKWAGEAPLKTICADTVVVEVTDRETGRVFRRTLPLDYMETDNGIRLSGDTLEGTPGHLAFLSDTAVARMKGLMGKGPDEHRCGD